MNNCLQFCIPQSSEGIPFQNSNTSSLIILYVGPVMLHLLYLAYYMVSKLQQKWVLSKPFPTNRLAGAMIKIVPC